MQSNRKKLEKHSKDEQNKEKKILLNNFIKVNFQYNYEHYYVLYECNDPQQKPTRSMFNSAYDSYFIVSLFKRSMT